MSREFDPYFEWLGIPPKHQPPNHYRLLNLDLFEQDVPLIAAAAQRVTARLHDVPPGTHDDAARRVLKEVMAAGSCLLDEDSKAAYDKKLRAKKNGAAKEAKPPADADDELRLEPLEPQVREVRKAQAVPPVATNQAVAMPPVANAAPMASRSGATPVRRPRNKQNPVVITGLLLLFVATAGAALYFVMIAPPGDDSSDVADSNDDKDKRKRKKKSSDKESSPDKITKREQPKRKPTGSGPADDTPPLDPIDAIGEHPQVKPSPFGPLPEWDDTPDPPDERPEVPAGDDDDDDDDDAPKDPPAAEELWKAAKSFVNKGDVDSAIPALEKYILHAEAKQHRKNADQLLAEARIADADEAMVAMVFEQLNDEQLDQLAEQRLTVRPRDRNGIELSNPALIEAYHKKLRAKVPEEKKRREAKKEGGGAVDDNF